MRIAHTKAEEKQEEKKRENLPESERHEDEIRGEPLSAERNIGHKESMRNSTVPIGKFWERRVKIVTRNVNKAKKGEARRKAKAE